MYVLKEKAGQVGRVIFLSFNLTMVKFPKKGFLSLCTEKGSTKSIHNQRHKETIEEEEEDERRREEHWRRSRVFPSPERFSATTHFFPARLLYLGTFRSGLFHPLHLVLSQDEEETSTLSCLLSVVQIHHRRPSFPSDLFEDSGVISIYRFL